MATFSVDQILFRADRHLRKGEFDAARILYDTVLATMPKNRRAHKGLLQLRAAKSGVDAEKELRKEQIDPLIETYNKGNFQELVHQAEALVSKYPSSFIAWNILGAGRQALGQLPEAERNFRKAAELNPAYAAAHYNMGSAMQEQGMLDEAIDAYRRAIKIKPTHADAHTNMGNALREQGKLDEAIAAYLRAIVIRPAYADAHYNMGNALKKQGKLGEAINAFRRAIEIKPAFAEAYYNMGSTIQEQGKSDEAVAAYQCAIKIKPSYAEAYNNMGNSLMMQGNLDEAIDAFLRAIEIEPGYGEAYNNMGNALQRQGKSEKAITAYRRAIEIKPEFAEAYRNMASVMHYQGKLDEAIDACRQAIAIKPVYAEAYYNMGNTLKEQGKLNEAIIAYEGALEIDTNYAAGEVLMLHLKQQVCNFAIAKHARTASAQLGISTQAVPPFAALNFEDSAKHHLLRAVNWSREEHKLGMLPLPIRPKILPKPLRVGYFSADFHDHATMFLLAGLLREHDRTVVETFGYSYGRSKSGEWRKRAENEFDHFVDVFDHSDREIVDVARLHGLDIAIDLKGYTAHSRWHLFKHRLAPIQINYLGYPGSMGAEFIDYIIGDTVVIPAEQREFYSEKVIYLPHSYQPNDNARPIADKKSSRSDCELPENSFVFCCFNNTYKISPSEFDIWMRILHKVEGSVLWLLRSNRWAECNLRKEAVARGIEPSRLVFAPKLPHSEHLERHKHADLFIDTFNVNAHTTASDALWAGLPIVTKQGQQFAARVGASLLTSIGLTELITNTEKEYEDLILELATNPPKLALVRAKLSKNRLTKPLFDTKRYARYFERGLKQAYERYFGGHAPDDIWISA